MPLKKLFSGLTLYFDPPRALSRLNGVKASACSKRGGIIQNKPDSTTTHVVVAKDRTSSQFWDLLSSARLSDKCRIVSNEWPSQSIERGKLLDIGPFEIQKAANDESISEKVEPAGPLKRVHSDSSSNSLKRARRENAVQQPQPRRSIPSSPEESDYSDTGNQVLIEVFHDLVISREATGEEFSARAYKRALKSLEAAKDTIRTEKDAMKLPNFSKRMAQLVADIRQGKIPNVLPHSARQKAQILQLFETVYGVGPYKARKLYDKGFRSLDEIRTEVDENGRVSIEHHQDLIERISRTEVDKHYQRIKKLVAFVDSELTVECMGSYRRGQIDCGDIDIILTKPGVNQRELEKVMKQLLQQMFSTGFAKHTFTQGNDRWLGATDVLSKWRRMDILLVPWDELGAAMIYYTGNDTFNRQLRFRAKQRGMRLNQTGLFRINATGEQELLEAHDEKRIFELLDVAWLEPSQRIY